MDQLFDFLPLLLPLVLLQFGLLGYTLYHICTHTRYKRGNRTIWLIVTLVLMNYIGPILYFLFGKGEE